MDLNYLLARHQTSLMLADRAASRIAQAAHLLAAGRLADRIATVRRSKHARAPMLTGLVPVPAAVGVA